MKKQKGRGTFIFLCTVPATVLFAVFMLYPAVSIFRIALYKWGGYSAEKRFVGLDNFRILLGDESFWQSFRNTCFLIVTVTVVTIALSLITAAILSRASIKGKSFFRVVFYIPNILSVVVIAAVFNAIYDPSFGLANSLINLLGGEGVMWLGQRRTVIYSVAVAMVWQAVGYYMVMYVASMAQVPNSLYEASAIEGAGGVRQFFTVTIPLIWENIRTTLTFFIISNINISFLLVRAMTGGGPDGASEVFLSFMYKQAYTGSAYGYGMAAGVVIFLFSFVLSWIVSRVTKREEM